jgi:hypothetical protein
MTMKGRDRFERTLDGFLEDVGALEAMLVPTPERTLCKDCQSREVSHVSALMRETFHQTEGNRIASGGGHNRDRIRRPASEVSWDRC